MVERSGCVSGSRGYGTRKFGNDVYDVYKVYAMSQNYGLDHNTFEKLKTENNTLMENDKSALKEKGFKVRVLHQVLGTVHVLYYKRK